MRVCLKPLDKMTFTQPERAHAEEPHHNKTYLQACMLQVLCADAFGLPGL